MHHRPRFFTSSLPWANKRRREHLPEKKARGVVSFCWSVSLRSLIYSGRPEGLNRFCSAVECLLSSEEAWCSPGRSLHHRPERFDHCSEREHRNEHQHRPRERQPEGCATSRAKGHIEE